MDNIQIKDLYEHNKRILFIVKDKKDELIIDFNNFTYN